MLYGRDAERAEIWALLEGARASRSGALVIRGEAGIGKSALLGDARESAGDMRVLQAHGVESESELPFAALHQLLRPALDLIGAIPPPQAAALGSALGLDGGAAQERFLISAGCLSLLSELAEQQPVLCLVDDVQWLDAPAADALLFVARRLDAEGIVMLFAARDGEGHRFEARDLPALELSGLSAEAAGELVAAAGEVAPTVRDVVVDRAAGNALALVEVPAALSAEQLAGAEPLPAALPLTQAAERLFLERVRGLPEATQQFLVVAAADDSGELAAVIRRAQQLGISADALTPAEQAGLISVAGSSVVLRHPLVRSAVYQAAPSVERRAAHIALAEAFAGEVDSDRRAWHRAAAVVEPDADVAEELEAAAERARRRSGHAAAASALERAAELSPDAESRARRLVASAAAAWHAGHPSRAIALADQASGIPLDPGLRAELDHVRGDIQHRCGSLFEAGETLMAGAVAAASHDPRKALDMLFDAASTGMQSGDYARVIEAGQRAAELPASDDEEERFLADLLVAVGSLWLGTTSAELPLVRDVIARAATFDKPRLLAGAAMGAGSIGDHESEAALLRRAVALARTSGAVDSLTLALLSVGVAGVLTGRFAVVPDAAEGLGLAREAGLTGVASLQLAVLAWFAASRGEEEQCLTWAAEVATSASATDNALARSIADWSLALLSLGIGRPDETVTRLAALRTAPPGVGHPLIVMLSAPDLVEAAVRTGDLESARAALAVLQSFAVAGAPSYALALAARCRALLDETDAADAEFARALELHEDGPRPFDRARTQLLFGEHLRRRRRRVEAREQLRSAAEVFESLGTAPWAERARSELRASGETARKRHPSTVDQLTPQELQIARLVAEGMTNKEVAAQLFLSPRTIDSHLRNVFGKVGIRSRTELARVALDGGGKVPVTSPV
jgi:DNA-binding CsgD family transcriptional regulator